MATLDRCPICNVSVKPENLLRHLNGTHPRHPDTPKLREQLKQKAGRGASRNAGRPIHIPKWVVLIVVLITAGVVGGYYLVNQQTRYNVVTWCGVEGTAIHYHPLLVINYNGVQQHLPWDPAQSADIGYLNQAGFTNPKYYCPAGELHLLHTHDGSGIIHVELPRAVSGTPTLGDFFTIWGEPLSAGQVWMFSGQLQATMYNSDSRSSADYSSGPAGLPLYESAAGPQGNAYPIPLAYIFNGAYGTGASSGFYSGEIIWLNVTA